MANTNDLKTLVEPYVREWLTQKYRQPFEEQELALNLITGGKHKFDIVAKNRSIVGGIKATSVGKNGRAGAGPIKSIFTELYFLSLVRAEKKLLILTDQGFYTFFIKIAAGKILPDTEVLYCALTEKGLCEKVVAVHQSARNEIGKRKQ